MRNLKTDFKAEISVFGFSFLPFDWEIRKRIWKTVLKNSSLARARIIRKKKTAVHEKSGFRFWKSKSGFPNQTVKMKIQKQISQLWNPFSDFAFDCKSEIRILKSKSRFPNRTVKMKIQKQISQLWNSFSDFAFDCKS